MSFRKRTILNCLFIAQSSLILFILYKLDVFETEVKCHAEFTDNFYLPNRTRTLKKNPTINPGQLGETLLFFVINTIPAKNNRREILRKTWAKHLTFVHSSGRVIHVRHLFVVGSENDPITDNQIERESKAHNDILVVNLTESYRNIIVKILMAFTWLTRLRIKPKFVVKADDDVYIKVPHLVRWIQNNSLPGKLYSGYVHKNAPVDRTPDSPHCVMRTQFKSKRFPAYCAGPFYVLSLNVLEEFVNASHEVPSFPVEDAYFGVLAKHIGVKPFYMDDSLFYWDRKLDAKIFSWNDRTQSPMAIALGDSLTSDAILKLHRLYWTGMRQILKTDLILNNRP